MPEHEFDQFLFLASDDPILFYAMVLSADLDGRVSLGHDLRSLARRGLTGFPSATEVDGLANEKGRKNGSTHSARVSAESGSQRVRARRSRGVSRGR